MPVRRVGSGRCFSRSDDVVVVLFVSQWSTEHIPSESCFGGRRVVSWFGFHGHCFLVEDWFPRFTPRRGSFFSIVFPFFWPILSSRFVIVEHFCSSDHICLCTNLVYLSRRRGLSCNLSRGGLVQTFLPQGPRAAFFSISSPRGASPSVSILRRETVGRRRRTGGDL